MPNLTELTTLDVAILSAIFGFISSLLTLTRYIEDKVKSWKKRKRRKQREKQQRLEQANRDPEMENGVHLPPRRTRHKR